MRLRKLCHTRTAMKGTSDDCLSISTVRANTTPEIGPFLIDAGLFEEAFETHKKRGDYDWRYPHRQAPPLRSRRNLRRAVDHPVIVFGRSFAIAPSRPQQARAGFSPSARLECARRRTRPPHNPTARPTSAVAAPTCTRPARKRAAAAPTRCGAVSGTAPRAGHRGAPGSAIDTRAACCGSGLGDGGSLEAGLGRAQGPPEGGLSRGKDIK